MTNSDQMLATIYVLPQCYSTLYTPAEALKYGTIFTNLRQPYQKKIH